MGFDLFDRAGQPIGIEDWTRLFADETYKRVAEDQVGPYWVSTIWLGLDHSHGYTSEPIIFETLVSVPDDAEGLGPDVDGHRYATEQAALDGHAELVTLIRATANLDPATLFNADGEGEA